MKHTSVKDFFGDTVDKNPPANAGDMDLILFPRKIPHAFTNKGKIAATAAAKSFQ